MKDVPYIKRTLRRYCPDLLISSKTNVENNVKVATLLAGQNKISTDNLVSYLDITCLYQCTKGSAKTHCKLHSCSPSASKISPAT
uniref:Uncharacterized protein n=1 Tax=Anguilla anguilla TaxID=7936 RepID=A0A0E9R9U5_ANGAN